MGCYLRLPAQVVVERSSGGMHRCSISGVRFYVVENESHRPALESGTDPEGDPRAVFGPSDQWVLEQACAVYSAENLRRWIEAIVEIKKTLGGKLEVLQPVQFSDSDAEISLR